MTIHQIIAYKTLLNGINYFNESVHRDLERTKNYNIHTNSQIDKENDLTKQDRDEMQDIPSSAPTLKAQIASLAQEHQKADGLYPHTQTNQHNPKT